MFVKNGNEKRLTPILQYFLETASMEDYEIFIGLNYTEEKQKNCLFTVKNHHHHHVHFIRLFSLHG